jgi:hypothetical protein
MIEGTPVKYNQFMGHVRFVCDEYITICVKQGESKLNDVCIVVSGERLDEVIELTK